MYEIRRVDPAAHAADLSELQEICLPGDVPCAPNEGDWWIVYEDDDAVGFALLSPSGRFKNCGYLARAGVIPTHRGRGLQKRLIRVRVRLARQRGWDYLYSDTSANAASGNSLIACGFKLYDPSHAYGFKWAIYYRLKLKGN